MPRLSGRISVNDLGQLRGNRVPHAAGRAQAGDQEHGIAVAEQLVIDPHVTQFGPGHLSTSNDSRHTANDCAAQFIARTAEQRACLVTFCTKRLAGEEFLQWSGLLRRRTGRRR